MKNDIKSKNFIVMRRYKPQDEDFFDDNPIKNSKNHIKMGGFNDSYIDIRNHENLEQELEQDITVQSDNKEHYIENDTDYEQDNTVHLLNISDIDVTNLVVNFDLNLNIFDPYDLYYNQVNDDSNSDNNDNDDNYYNDEFNNFFGES